MMKRKLILILAAVCAAGTLLLTSCENTALLRTSTALAVSNTLQYAVPKAERAQVATEIRTIGSLYIQFFSTDGKFPTPEQFKLVLDTYIPASETKEMTTINILGLYSANYALFKDKSPKVQLDALSQFLLGAQDGAVPFL